MGNEVHIGMTTERAREALEALDSIDGVSVVNLEGQPVTFSLRALGLKPLREALFSTLYTETRSEVERLREALAARDAADAQKAAEDAAFAAEHSRVCMELNGLRLELEALRARSTGLAKVFDEIAAERARQDARWGEQNHPMVPLDAEANARALDLTPAIYACFAVGLVDADEARDACEDAARNGYITYPHILVEEAAEFVDACVLHGETSDEARTEMVQAAAVAVAMIECLDRKRAAQNGGAR